LLSILADIERHVVPSIARAIDSGLSAAGKANEDERMAASLPNRA